MACRRSRVQQLVEEPHDLVAVHRTIKIRCHSRHINSFAAIVRPALLQPLQKNGDTVFRTGLPGFTDQSPEIIRQRILFGEFHIDHRKRRAFSLIGANQEMRDDDILDVGRIEFAEELCAQAGDRRQKISGSQRLPGGRRRLRNGGLGRNFKDCGSTARQKRSSFHGCFLLKEDPTCW